MTTPSPGSVSTRSTSTMPAMTSGTSRIRAGSGAQPSRRCANAAKDSNTPPGSA